MEITEEYIAKQIKTLIDNSINSLNNVDKRWELHYKEIMCEISEEILICEEKIKDFREENLRINTIEQEGYLRCLKTMYNRFRDWEKDI